MIKTYMYPKRKEHTRKDTDNLIIYSVEKFKTEAGLIPICAGVWHDSKGKPYLYDSDGLFVSASHTDKKVIIAISDTEIGIDIEETTRNIHSEDRIMRKYFTDNEKDYVLSCPQEKRERFLEIWVKKESYVKLTGDGISQIPKISVIPPLQGIVFEKADIPDGYICYLCYRK